jgi:hypothetical protein
MVRDSSLAKCSGPLPRPHLCRIWRPCNMDFSAEFGEQKRQAAGTASLTLQKFTGIYNSALVTKYFLEFQANMASAKKVIVVIG